MKIFLNNQEITFDTQDLPMLISGGHGAGSSLFTIHVMHQLMQSGKKILFFTALPAAKEDFKKLLSASELAATEFVEGDEIEGKQTVVLLSGDEQAFINALHKLEDADERILLIKNMDQFSERLFDLVRERGNLVLSGDVEVTAFADGLREKDFATKIFFTQSDKYPLEGFPSLDKYKGLMVRRGQRGEVCLKQ